MLVFPASTCAKIPSTVSFIKQKLSADQVFDPTLAFAGFSEDLLLSYAMITPPLAVAYVGPFAHSWPGLATSDRIAKIIIHFGAV